MPRVYNVTFENVTVSAVQDLFNIIGATGKMLRILRVGIKATTAVPTNQQLSFRARFLPATVTNGTGGSTPTPTKKDQGDAAATFTARCNDATTKASSSGTAVIVYEGAENVYAGYDEQYANPVPVPPGTSFVFELIVAPTGTLALSGICEVEETG